MNLERLAAPPVRGGAGSVMDRWLESLDNAERDAVMKAIRNPEWRHVDLQAVLVDEGAPKVADTTFGDWRRKMARHAG